MARKYVVPFENVTVSAAQDLLQITGATGKMLQIERIWCYADSESGALPTAQLLAFRARTLTATVTNGSGGTTPTISKVDPGDASASFTALANNTTKATTSGTAIVQEESGAHIYSGHDVSFPLNRQPPIGPGEAFVYELLSTVSGTVTLSGGAWVSEIGG